MDTENMYFLKYVEQYGGLVTDTENFPFELKRFLTECQYSIKEGVNFVSNYEEIYNFRPEFIVGFLRSVRKTAFTCTNDANNKCFIGISLGLTLSIHNILYEALRADAGFLDYYLKDVYKEIGKEYYKTIRPSIINPADIDGLVEQFCQCRQYDIDDEKRQTIDAIIFTSIDFICKHELAHFFRSHSTFLYDGVTLKHFDEEYSNLYFASNIDMDIHRRLFMKAIESDADTQAIIMALRELESIFIDDYNTDKDIDQDIILDTLFEFGLALGVLFLCLDNQLNIEIQFKSTHPPAIVRFQNAVYIMQRYFETIYDSDRSNLQEENLNILLEIENLALLMGYPEGLWLRFEKPQDDKYLDLDDMIKFWNKDHASTEEILKQIDEHATYDFIGINIT